MSEKKNIGLKNTGIMCSVEVADANREDGVRFVDLGNYFDFGGKHVLLTTLTLAKRYGHLVDVDIYIRRSNAKADLPAIAGKVRRVVGQIICPECGVFVDSADVCVCGYEHQCGGSAESCRVPGCAECGMPNSDITGK